MEWNYKNRGRCHIGKNKLKVKLIKIVFGLILVIIISFSVLLFLDNRVNKMLDQYINIEVERYVNNVISKALREKISQLSKNEYTNISNSQNYNNINAISYNTVKMNAIKDELEATVQQEIIKIENGDLNDYFIPFRIKSRRYKKIKNAILCDVSIGSIRNSLLFANVGPTIPIKLIFTGHTNSEIEVKKKEYGINNIIIETSIKIIIHEQAIMPISSKTKTIVLREPLSIDIINGKTPNYYGTYIK